MRAGPRRLNEDAIRSIGATAISSGLEQKMPVGQSRKKLPKLPLILFWSFSSAFAGTINTLHYDTYVNNDPSRCEAVLEYLSQAKIQNLDDDGLCAFRSANFQSPSKTSRVELLPWVSVGSHSPREVASLLVAQLRFHPPGGYGLNLPSEEEAKFSNFISSLARETKISIDQADIDIDGQHFSAMKVNAATCEHNGEAWYTLPQLAIFKGPGEEKLVPVYPATAGVPLYVDHKLVLLTFVDEKWTLSGGDLKKGRRLELMGAVEYLNAGAWIAPSNLCSFTIYK
jgi:hypothetical protein